MAEPQLISNKYEFLRQLGLGGMGVVYQVRHVNLGSVYALKVLPAQLMENPDLITRFRFEAQLMAQLNHPGIVKVIDFDQDHEQGFYYYIMEYIEGKTLGQHLRERGALPLSEVLVIARQAAEALAYAHARKPAIIHRDISPSNLMIRQSDGAVVVMDFGIAKVLGSEGLTAVGSQGGWMGKPKYCSPEQMRQEDLDGQADVYSLGMVMYELCTGQQFFAGMNTNQVIAWVQDDARENEPEFPAQVPDSFAAIVRKAIAKSRRQRYQRMEDLRLDLAACESGQVVAVESVQSDGATVILNPEEELQRQRVRRTQDDTQFAYELAKRAEADRWAAALFGQATQRDQEAKAHFAAREYDAARIAYQEAAALFDQAREQARVEAEAARQAAEQAQHAMRTAKDQAEHENARERAPRLYAQGLRLQRQGDVQFEAKVYDQAAQEYTSARIAFADASVLAHDERRTEVEVLQAQVREGKTAAENVGAPDLATVTFQAATEQEQQADTAWQQDDLTLAGRYYTAAQEHFQRAHDQAHTEHVRRQAIALQERIGHAQERGAVLGISQYASSPAEHAAAEQTQGNAAFEAAAYPKAIAHYRTALNRYEQAIQDTQHTLVQLSQAARQAVQAAREAAEAAGAKERYGSEFAAVEAALDQAQSCEAEQAYVEAQQRYSAAQKEFETLKHQAEQAVARERANTARQQMVVVRQQAEPVQEWAEEHWAAAQAEEQRAEQAYAEANYSHAQAGFEHAQRLYTQASQEGETGRLRAEIGQAARAVSTAQRLAEHAQAQDYAAPLYADGQAAYTAARQASQAEQWQAALEAYQRAQTLFEQATQAAQTHRRRLETIESYAEVEKAQTAASQAGAQERFPADYQRGQALVTQGQQHQAAQAYVEAQEAYQRAVQQFDTLRQQAQQAVAQENAQAALDRLQQEQHRSPALRAWAQAAWTQADQLAQDVQAAWQQHDYDQVEALAEHAHRAYEQAVALARTERFVEQAGQAGEQALLARQAAQAAGAPHYAPAAYERAVAAQTRAENELEAGASEHTPKLFSEAQVLFEAATQAAHHEQARLRAAETAAQVDAAQQAAAQAGALERYETEFRALVSLVQQGCEREAEEAYPEAHQLYQEAQGQFVALQKRAERAAAQEQAESKRGQVTLAREQAAALQEWATPQWAEAEAGVTQAEQAYQTEAYQQAAELFETARMLFGRVRVEGETARLQAEAGQQAQATRETRTAAEAEQAARYAAAVFQDGQTTYQEAERQARAADWQVAIERYQQAQQLFSQAAEKARAERARHAAVQAGMDAEAARQTAEQAGAKERYPAEFRKARLLVRRGQEHITAEKHTEARQRFAEAGRQFMTLKEQAEVAFAQEEAEAARSRLEAFQRHSEALRAWAKGLWKRADKTARHAEAAWTQADYPRATTLYEQAVQAAERAAEQARLEQRIEQAEQTQHAARLAGQQAEEVFAPDDAPTAYRRATEVQRQAQHQFDRKAWDEAIILFQEAQTLFETAAQASQHEQARRAATEAHQAARTAQSAAQESGAPDRYRAECTAAQQLVQQGQKSEEEEAFAQAREQYQAAQRQFDVLRHQAERDRAREQAQALQQKMAAARGAAGELREWAEQRWAQAHEQEQAGERAYRHADYRQALTSFEVAYALYTQVRTEGEAAQLQAEAEQAAVAAGQVRQLAEEAGAETYAPEVFAEGQATYRQARERAGAADWQATRAAYQHAQETFTAAAAAAQQEQARQAAGAAYQNAQQARTTAEQVGAHVRYPEAFVAAQAAVEQGQAYSAQETREAYRQAQQHYSQAQDQYTTLRQSAEQATARDQAEAARQQLAPVRAAAQALAPEWAPELWTQAQDLETQAGQAWQAERYAEARALYRQTSERYQQAHGEAAARHRRHRAQRDRAHQAGALAREAQQAAAELSGRRKMRAERLLAEGDRLFVQQIFAEAQVQYEQAATLFEAVCQPPPAWQRALLPAAALLVIGIGVTLFYRSRPAPPPNTPPSIHRVEPTPEAGQPVVVSASRPNIFRVEATDPDAGGELQYTWFLDETQVATGPSWTFDAIFPTGELTIADPQPATQRVTVAIGETRPFAVQATLQPGAAQHRQVRVEVTDRHGATVQHQWDIEVQPIDASPSELEYVWYLDTQEVARSQTWNFQAAVTGGELAITQPQPSESHVRVEPGKQLTFAVQAIVRGVEPELRQVRVKIASPSGAQVQRAWDLTVLPSGGDNLDKRDLVYTWFMDGQEVARGKTWSFQAPSASAAAHTLAISAAEPKSRQVLVQAGTSREFWAQPIMKNGTRQTDLRKHVLVQVADASGVRGQRTWDVTVVQTGVAESADRFRYIWYLDGKEAARTPRWVFQAPETTAKLALLNPQPASDRVRLTAGTSRQFSIQAAVRADAPKRQVRVQITGPQGTTVQRAWEVTVQPQPGSKRNQDQLRYRWFVDGTQIASATDQSWSFTAPTPGWEVSLDNPQPASRQVAVEPGTSQQFSVQGKIRGQALPAREVRVEVAAPRGQKEQQTWTVIVQNPPPTSHPLRYEWIIDQTKSQTGQHGVFTFSNSRPGTYHLAAVAIGPDGLRSTPQSWTIKIPEPSLQPSTITTQDVQQWLNVYTQAWENRDVTQLVQLEKYTPEQADQANAALSQYSDYRVELKDVDIQIDGDQARVTAKRVDTMTIRGFSPQTMAHPKAHTFVLRKDKQGSIVRVR